MEPVLVKIGDQEQIVASRVRTAPNGNKSGDTGVKSDVQAQVTIQSGTARNGGGALRQPTQAARRHVLRAGIHGSRLVKVSTVANKLELFTLFDRLRAARRHGLAVPTNACTLLVTSFCAFSSYIFGYAVLHARLW
jgi:hypothetical protein